MANVITVKETEIKIGDVIKISYNIHEGGKTKDQIFEGMVIKIKGTEVNKMFTVRKVTKEKIGIERIFSISSPFIDKIQVVSNSNVRRAKLYYVRGLSDKDIRLRLS